MRRFEEFGGYLYSLLVESLKKTKQAANQFFLFFQVVGTLFDDAKEDVFRARLESAVISCSETMLPVHGEERQMPRLKGESAENYRIRLSMKALTAEKAGSKEGILLTLTSLGYEQSRIQPYHTIDPDRWAEFIIYMGPGNDWAIRELLTVYTEVQKIKQASSKLAYLVYTDNEVLESALRLGLITSSYAELTLNDADDLILVRDRAFNSPLNMGVVWSSYSEMILTPEKSFDITLSLSPIISSYKEETIQ